MDLVLSAFTSSPISILATIKASASSFIVCVLPQHPQHKAEADVYHLVSSHPGLPEPP